MTDHFADAKEKWDEIKLHMSQMREDDWIEIGFTLLGGLMILCSTFLMFGWPSIMFWVGMFLWRYEDRP